MTDTVDSRSIWMIEGKEQTKGSPILWKSEFVRFKNLSTGMYLRWVLKESGFNASTGGSVASLVFTKTEDGTGQDTLFKFFEPNATSKHANKGKALQISAAGVWLARGEVVDLDFKVQSTPDKANAVSLLVQDYVDFTPSTGHSRQKSCRDVFSALSIEKYMLRFFHKTIIPTNKTATTLWPGAGRNDMTQFNNLITKCKNFSQGFGISDEHIVLGVDKSDQALRVARQVMLRSWA